MGGELLPLEKWVDVVDAWKDAARSGLVVSAFPGVKSEALFTQTDFKAVELDSPLFRWAADGAEQENWMERYGRAIVESLKEEWDILVLPSHQEVRDFLVSEGIPFLLLYPAEGYKEVWKLRLEAQGYEGRVVSTVMENWEDWIRGCRAQQGCQHFVLSADEATEHGYS
ncbi:Uu.00g010900.m01.CDS01 [Anthostomella pinea]|uniref:Uu.00g010900.m01.CDS01 n=1 Tax=Anthostomella pinea TaxID=933095 RepID=A0AAI8VRW7_9PEZI|nr:Uu.00g136800.m01.CDS01 [Anthostomella pinea]CAJ2512971.1 Uu.00g010900.m01.CDS01 [Anthostomella pinea]